MGELVAGTDNLHAEVLVGPHHVARTQPPHVEHHLIAFHARLVLLYHRIHQRLILGDHLFGILFNGVIKEGGDLTQ